ncbi:MAG: glycosyl transferase family 39 [Ramlibacter sp.]|nr:glycosyl transferase family 39 [Ramlibacter sp.]
MAEPAAVHAAGGRPAASLALRIGWALALLLPLFCMLGATPLVDVDEGAFSEATREMLASGDWGHATLNGAPRFDKPIGTYWLQAASVWLFGLSAFALRLPSALACWAMALALSQFAARRWGERAGALAGVLAVTSLGTQLIGRAATADGLLNLLLVLAGLDLWRHIESGRKAPLRRTYAWAGLGLLVKGPVALLVPAGAFLVWCASGRRWALLRSALTDWRGWALLLGLSLPWYAYALQRHGMAFVDGFLMHHNVQRFTGTVGGHSGSPLYYLVVLPLLSMPWAPLLAMVAARARGLWREPLGRYLLGWSGFVLVFFSLSSTKLPHYMLYGYGPLVLLMARLLSHASVRLQRVVGCFLAGWVLVVAALPWVVVRAGASVRDPFYRALLSGAAMPAWWPAAAAVAAVLVLAFWRGRGEAAWTRTPAAAGILAVLVGGWALPWFGETLQGPVRGAAAVAAAREGPAVQWGVHLPSFAVYLGRPAPVRAPQPQEMALARADRLPPGDDGRRRLFEERGLVLLGPRETR